jgi:cellulose synthase/poly-beta-1,6-N-acetylglucosamine synthase-like glycosyltransferase
VEDTHETQPNAFEARPGTISIAPTKAGLMDALLVLMALFFGIPLAIFCFYGLVLLYYGKMGTGKPETTHAKEQIAQRTYEPTVSVVMPTHNEQEVIAKRIDNLLASNYPKDKMEILFVDDSFDSTPKIIEQYIKTYPQIRIIRFNERMGYSYCLIAGCKAAQGDVIVLSEASSLTDPNAIKYLVSNFVNPDVGTVTGKSVILNVATEAERSEHFYQKLWNFAKNAESNMGSTIYMSGEAAAVRREVVLDLQELEKCPGTADTGLAILARKKGYKAIYDPRVLFFQYAPSTHHDRVRQKVTRGANLIKILWEFRSMFLNPKYGKFGMITLPLSLAMLALVPILLLGGFLVLAVLMATNPITYLPVWALMAFLFVLAYVFWKPALLAILESEYSLLKGLYDILILRRNHDKIDKVMSTRRLDS